MRRAKRLVCEYGDPAVITISSIGLALSSGWDGKPDWLGEDWTLWLLVALLLAFGIFSPVRRLCHGARLQQLGKVDNRLKTTLVDIAQATGLDPNKLAIHLWSVDRTWTHPFVGELRRVRHFSLRDQPLTRAVTFQKGEGVVGMAWSKNRPVGRDIEHEFAAIRSETEWDRLKAKDKDKVMGMSWEKFQETRHRGAVGATPIRSNNKVRGVVSIDSEGGYTQLWTDATENLLNRLARELQEWNALSVISEL